MRTFAPSLSARILMAVAAALALGACQSQTTTSNNLSNATNNGAVNVNTSNANMTTTTTTSPAGTTIETTEPQQYSATITLKVEVTGDTKNMSTPPLTAEFARNGSDRRISFKIPGGEQVVYLDRADKRFIILPNRKQYAEIDAQSTGFNVPQVMTPAQIISQVKGVRGCQQTGEEQFGGRTAFKYRCEAAAKTATQAGDVKTESFVYVDKETSLPLHSESVISSSGNVGGASAVKIVTELSNINTNVPATTFGEPSGMNKVDPAQVRAQVETLLKAAAYFAQGMMGGGGGGNTAPAATPATTPAVNTTPTH